MLNLLFSYLFLDFHYLFFYGDLNPIRLETYHWNNDYLHWLALVSIHIWMAAPNFFEGLVDGCIVVGINLDVPLDSSASESDPFSYNYREFSILHAVTVSALMDLTPQSDARGRQQEAGTVSMQFY
jgi:hypothetical protein